MKSKVTHDNWKAYCQTKRGSIALEIVNACPNYGFKSELTMDVFSRANDVYYVILIEEKKVYVDTTKDRVTAKHRKVDKFEIIRYICNYNNRQAKHLAKHYASTRKSTSEDRD